MTRCSDFLTKFSLGGETLSNGFFRHECLLENASHVGFDGVDSQTFELVLLES